MNLIKKIGTLGVRGHTVLYVLIGLLVSEASSADSSEQDASSLQLKLNLLKNRYRLLRIQYDNLAANCSALGTFLFQGPATKSICPDGWLHVGDQCFLLGTDRDDFSNSTAKCSEIGAHLAILTTKEQHDVMEREGRTIGGISSYYWIGLTDIASEGDWRWPDNSTLITPFWDVSQSQPDNHQSGGTEGEDCAVLHSYTQVWYDVPCSFIYPRICQMDAIPLD